MVVHGPKAIDHETWQKTSGEQSDSMLILLVGGKYQQRLNYGCDTDATIDRRTRLSKMSTGMPAIDAHD